MYSKFNKGKKRIETEVIILPYSKLTPELTITMVTKDCTPNRSLRCRVDLVMSFQKNEV